MYLFRGGGWGISIYVCICLEVEDEDKYLPVNDDPMSHLILEAIKNDELRKVNKELELVCSKGT